MHLFDKGGNKPGTRRLLMQYARLLPARLGLINKAAFQMQIKRINPDDIFLVSYPKSGNTWVRFIIAYLKKGTNKTLTFNDIEQIVPDVYISKDIIDSMHSGRIIKTHDIRPQHYPRMIYVYRDYRDALVSYYHYQKNNKQFEGSFSEFIRSDKTLSSHGSWKEHLKKALAYNEEKPGKCLLISYEQLSNEFESSASKIAAFCEMDAPIDMEQLKLNTGFDKIKADENKYGSIYMQYTGKNFMRKGKAGSWKDTFSDDDLAYLYSDKETADMLVRLGYEL